jgi:hypothetical protein
MFGGQPFLGNQVTARDFNGRRNDRLTGLANWGSSGRMPFGIGHYDGAIK